ncbi:MAG: pyruvate kinase [Candidatus Promineifilaceae bacterium]
MARTKIVATIGPATNNEPAVRALLAAGMNVARINFSHGEAADHGATVEMLRRVALAEGKVLAILGDLQGPKLRLGYVKAGGIPLDIGDEVVLTPHRGQPGMIHLPHPRLIAAVEPGSRLILGDGEVELVVHSKQDDTLRCQVTVPGLLESRKGISAPGAHLSISSMTDKDRDDLGLICELDLDFVALSFVRSAADICEMRALMRDKYHKATPIIAKIEKSEAIAHLTEIRDEADGLMVARGDLGIEMPPQEVPFLQKRIIAACNEVGKPVITATQMLQSMVNHPRPTRAEASDVANAILDGTDAVMLSQETATGLYPEESVLMMRHIAEITEREFPYDMWRVRRKSSARSDSNVTVAISAASCSVAEEVGAQAIVTTTMSGYTARQIARYRPPTPVLAVTPNPRTQRHLSLVWGVESLVVEQYFENTDDMFRQTVAAYEAYAGQNGGRIIITAGIPFGSSGQSNLIQVHELG